MTTLTWGFESGFAEDSSSTLEVFDWSESTFNATLTRSTAQAHSGTYSMRMEWPSIPYLAGSWASIGVQADVELSAWVFVPTGSGPVRLATGNVYVESTTNDAWEELTLSATGLDFTTGNWYGQFGITVAGPSSSGSVYVDDVAISYTLPLITPYIQTVLTTVNQPIVATEAYTGLTGATYSISPTPPSGFSFNTSTGVLSGTPTSTLATTAYTVTGTDGVDTGTATILLTVEASYLYPDEQSVTGTTGIEITPTASYTGFYGATYSISPAPSAGLSFDTSTGVLSGTPTTAGLTNYTVTATNGTDTLTATIDVDIAASSLSPATQSLSGILNQAVTSTTAFTGLPGATYSISPAPSAGLSFDTSTGVLSGTPTESGSTVYTITATLGSVTATATITATVSAPIGILNGIYGPLLSLQLWRRDLGPDDREWQSLDAADLKEISFRRGRSRPDFGYDSGTMTVVLDNASGNYDPDWSGSDWYPLLAAGTKFRLVATWDEVDYTLFTGFLESNQIDHGFAPTSTLTVADAISRISAIPTTAMSDALYDTEYDDEPVFDSSGTSPEGRLVRLVDAGLAAFLGTSGTVDVWDVPDDLLRKLTPIRKGANFTQILDECALVEGGIWYITKENLLGMYRADNKFDRPTRLYLSDSRAANTVEYDSLLVSPGAAILCNDARLSVPGRNGNDEQYWWQYSASVSSIGIKSIQLSAPIYNTDWAQTLAKYFCRRYAEPKSYASHVEFSAQALDVLYPDLLSCELADLVTIERTTVDGRTLTWNCVLEGIEHRITPTSWRVAFNTSPVNGFYPSL